MAWRLGDAPFSARREEDAQAVQALGAQKVHLDLLDAMYRRDAVGQVLYPKDTVRVPVHPDDWKRYEPAMRERLREVLSTHNGDAIQVFCPLAVGEHVDHIIVRRAVEELYTPRQITYYEDYPYAGKLDDVRAKLGLDGRLETWESMTISLTRDEVQARIAAVACYRSQMRGLFPSELERWQEIAQARLPVLGRYLDWPADPCASRERMASSVQAYIARVGGERYWRRCA